MTSKTPETKPQKLPRRIQVLNRQRRFRISGDSAAVFCSALLRALGQPDSALSIVFVSAQEMRGLNQKYRGKDYATDVLSFSYTGEIIGNTPLLGEIIISPEIAYRNAARYRTSLERELRKLLAHGMLHLLGYDHEVDRGLMNRLQAKLMRRRLFINTPPLES